MSNHRHPSELMSEVIDLLELGSDQTFSGDWSPYNYDGSAYILDTPQGEAYLVTVTEYEKLGQHEETN